MNTHHSLAVDQPPAETHAPKETKFPQDPEYKDSLWTVAFIVHLLIVVTGGFVFMFSSTSTTSSSSAISDLDTSDAIIIGLTYAITGLFTSCLWLFLLLQFAYYLVWAALLSGPIICGILTIISLIYGIPSLAIVFAILFILSAFYVYVVSDRIPFAVSVIELAVSVLKLFPQLASISIVSVIVQCGWISLWLFCFQNAYIAISSLYSGLSGYVETIYVFSFYWTSQVVSNVVLVIVSGVYAEWYFSYPEMRDSPTTRNLKKACTSSFGPICYGSFIIAIIKTLRYLFRKLTRRKNSVSTCIANCCLRCIEDIARYVNLYALVYVSTYGMDYCEAAKSVFELFSYRGFDVVINDDLVGGVLAVGSLFTGGIVATVSFLVCEVVSPDLSLVIAAIGFFIGIVMSFCTLVIIQSAVSTILVCYCEDPGALYQTKPEVYKKLTNSFVLRFGHSCDMFTQE